MNITKLKRVSDNLIFTFDYDEELYINGNQKIHELDCFCNNDYIFYEVEDDDNGDKTLMIGDRISESITIIGFKYIQGEGIVITNQQAPHNTIRFVNAEKYIEPVVQPRTTRRTRTQTTDVVTDTLETTTNNPFAEIEQQILSRNTRPIRLERLLKRRTESLQEFLERFFEQWNNDRNTIYCDDSSVQTDMGRRRSLGDIYMICKYYYPNCTLNEVLNLLINVLPESMHDGFRSSYCSTIHKRVWYFNEDEDTEVFNKTTTDEFGKQWSFYEQNIQ